MKSKFECSIKTRGYPVVAVNWTTGFIRLGVQELSPRQATELALELLEACRVSIDRNQIGTSNYNSTQNITRRGSDKLGKATRAVRRIWT